MNYNQPGGQSYINAPDTQTEQSEVLSEPAVTAEQSAALNDVNVTAEQNAENIEKPEKRKKEEKKGKYVSDLSDSELDKLQRKKTFFMYLGTLFFAVSLFLEVDGRARLSENSNLFTLFAMYVIADVALIVLTVVISAFNRTRHKIRREVLCKHAPEGGFDRRTYLTYEIYNVMHLALAAAEIVVSFYKIGDCGALDIAFAVINVVAAIASAVCTFYSRTVLFKANARHTQYVDDFNK